MGGCGRAFFGWVGVSGGVWRGIFWVEWVGVRGYYFGWVGIGETLFWVSGGEWGCIMGAFFGGRCGWGLVGHYLFLSSWGGWMNTLGGWG